MVIAGICLIASAFISGSEIAYFGLTPSDIENLEESESPGAAKALKMLDKS